MSRFQSPLFKLARAVLAGVTVVLLCGGFSGPVTIQITPDEACSGQTVLLRVEKAGFKDANAISVTIADQAAPIVRVVDRETIEVMVPRLSAGEARVRLEYKRGMVTEGTMMIIPSPLRRIFLQMEHDTITVERTRPYNGEYDRNATSGRRLSYDVIGENGQLLYTGAIPHPAEGTIEVFGSAGSPSPHRVPAREPYHFAIKIPYSRGTTIVRLYEARDGVDLSTQKGRAARNLIREIEVGERK